MKRISKHWQDLLKPFGLADCGNMSKVRSGPLFFGRGLTVRIGR